MSPKAKHVVILMADDDQEDCMLARDALNEARLANDFHTVDNGQELLDYLRCKGKYEKAGEDCPKPGLILLDLNMPVMDGREALQHIKADADLRRIPIIVLTTSKAEEDIYRTYDLGANSYITKPVTFDKLVDVVKILAAYWFSIVELPEESG